MADIGNDILRAAVILKSGRLVGIPTETVYGLAANAYNSEAAAHIFTVKNRPSFDPLIVHTHSYEAAKEFVRDIPNKAAALAEEFWPGPLTLLLPKTNLIPTLVTSGMERVAVRVPNHSLTLKLLKSLEFPLVAPSANPFGYVSPTTAKHVNEQLGRRIEYILDGGSAHVGIESTIVGFENNKPVIYRLGGISVDDIERVIGPVTVAAYSTSNPKSPGMLKSHYSPGKLVVLGKIDELVEKYKGKKLGILTFTAARNYQKFGEHLSLSVKGDLEDAARNLFAHLRAFDAMDIEVVLSEQLPEEGIGRAINDRLRRAAAEE